MLLAEGHLLIEDVPGVGKTKLAKALARSIDCSVRRIQFTPDLLPSDVTGVSVYNQENRDFEFKPGAVFANLVVGDEINRASPKTQSALLECMEERQVTVDGITYQLQAPFMVIATQNPIEMEGTYPLPEAQRDRFTARIAMGYPDTARRAGDARRARRPTTRSTTSAPVTDAATVRRLIATVRDVHVADAVKQYAVDLVTATRESPDLRLGASPRATLQLLRTARAVAALEGRDYVLPDDLQALAVPVLAHRIIPTAEAQLGRRTTDAIVAEIVHRLPLPHDRQRSPYDTGSDDGRAHQTGGDDHAGGAARTDHARSLLPRGGRGGRHSPRWSSARRTCCGSRSCWPRCRCSPRPTSAQTRYRLACTRVAASPAGCRSVASARVMLRLQNLSRLPTGTLLLEDRLPYALGSRPRLVLERLGGATGQLGGVHGAGRGARPLRGRPAGGAADRPVRAVRADPVVPQRRPAHRDPAGRRRCRRSGWPASTPAAATAGPGRSPCTARTTSRPGSTARRRPAPGALALDRARSAS